MYFMAIEANLLFQMDTYYTWSCLTKIQGGAPEIHLFEVKNVRISVLTFSRILFEIQPRLKYLQQKLDHI